MKKRRILAAVLAFCMVSSVMLGAMPVAAHDATDGVISDQRANITYMYLGKTNAISVKPGMTETVFNPQTDWEAGKILWFGVRFSEMSRAAGADMFNAAATTANTAEQKVGGLSDLTLAYAFDSRYLSFENYEVATMFDYVKGNYVNNGSQYLYMAASEEPTVLTKNGSEEPFKLTTAVDDKTNGVGDTKEAYMKIGFNQSASALYKPATRRMFQNNSVGGAYANGNVDDKDVMMAVFGFAMVGATPPPAGTKIIQGMQSNSGIVIATNFAGDSAFAYASNRAASADANLKNKFNIVNSSKTAISDGVIDLFPKVVATRKVTYALTNLSKTAGDATVKDEVTNFTATLKANAGYKLPAAVVVKMGNTTLTATNDYTYDSATGVIAISKAVDGDITITAVGTALGALTYTGSALTAQTYDTVLSGAPTVGTATSAEGGETITKYALKAGSALPEGFSLNGTTGAITGKSTKAYPGTTGKAFTITATTSLGRTIDANFTMVVAKKALTPTAVTAGVPSVNKGATGAALTVVGSSDLAATQATATGYKNGDAVVLKYNAVYTNATTAADKVEVTLNAFTIEGADAANYEIQQPAPALTAAIGKIVEKQVTGVAFTKAPTKTTFTHGDKLDLTGAEVTVSWDKGNPATVHKVTAFNSATGATTLDVALPAGYVFKVGTKGGAAVELNLNTGLVLKATKNNDQEVSVVGTKTSTANPTLTVNKKNLTVTLVGTPKVYDGTTAGNGAVATIVADGIIGTEKVTVNATGGTFATTDAGTGIALNGVNLAFGTHATDDADAANYALTARAMDTTADITKADYKVEDFTAKTGAKNVMGTAFTIDQLIAAANSKNNEIASQVLKGTGFANVAITYTTTAAVPVAVADITKASAGTYNFTVTIPFADKDNFTNYTLKDGANAMTANKVITGIVTVANKPYIPPAPSDPTYTITYDEGVNGTITTNGTTSVVQGNKITKVPVVKAKPGFVFKGWSADGKTVIDLLSYEIKGNIKFTAVYKEAGKPVGFDKKTAEPYVKGYENNTFGPQNPIKRAEVATMLARILSEKMENGKTYNSIFADVAASAWYSSYVGFMEQFDIIKGTNGSFNPEASITRAEFVAMVMRVEGMAEGKTSSFPDVKDHWAENEIANAVEKGYIKGYADGSFAPDQTITRAEAVTILNRVLGRTAITDAASPFTDVPANHWAFGDIVAAAK